MAFGELRSRTLLYLVTACVVLAVTGTADPGLAQAPRKTKLAPPEVFQPPAPYSQGFATQGKRTIYVSGQVGLDEKGNLAGGKGDAEAQTRQAFRNMKAVLEAAGATMDDVVKLTTVVVRLADFAKIAAVRKEFFREPYPASTTFVAGLLNPDWLVEIEAIAVVD